LIRDFFVSYAGRDRPWARWAAALLESGGFSVEFDVFAREERVALLERRMPEAGDVADALAVQLGVRPAPDA
jgi:hypothetical protein